MNILREIADDGIAGTMLIISLVLSTAASIIGIAIAATLLSIM